MTLAPIDDLATFTATRDGLHAVAEHVLASYRYREDRRIGLVVTDDGFGTPDLGPAGAVRVARTDLEVDRGGSTTRAPLTTIAAAAAACGIEPGAPDVYPPVTPLAAEAPLMIDRDASERIAAWLALAWPLLEELGGDAEAPTLWPEHFDAAVELGDEAAGARGTFGASLGDDAHPTPYLYVTHWADVPEHEYWNDRAFPGASLSYDDIVTSARPVAVARAFFDSGRTVLGQA